MTRSSFLALFCLGVLPCIAQEPQPSATPSSTPAATAAPSREKLASAPGGYLDLPVKSSFGYSSVHVNGPYIAMTFDDGPDSPLTPRLLDILKARGIKVTFFVLGQRVAEYPDILKRAAAEGHEIANHSWSHPNFAKMSDGAVRNELKKTQDLIEQTIGVRPTLLRPPYGSITKRQREWIHSEFGYKIILWDVDPLDWRYHNAERVQREILHQTHQGSIVLSHDIHRTTIDAMPATFDALLAKGFKFVTVSGLLALEKPTAPAPSPSPSVKKKKT